MKLVNIIQQHNLCYNIWKQLFTLHVASCRIGSWTLVKVLGGFLVATSEPLYFLSVQIK